MSASPSESEPAPKVRALERHLVFRKLLLYASYALVTLQFGRLIVVNPHRAEFNHKDEPYWMWVSYHAWANLVEGDWDSPYWAEEYWSGVGPFGSPKPQLGKYLIGAPLKYYLDLNPDRELHAWREEEVAVELYHPARLAAAVFMLLTAFLLIDLAAEVFRPAVALVASILFVAHPYVEYSSFRAMTDAPALFGATLALWGLFRNRPWARTLAVGFGLGWAVATRINGLLVVPAIAVVLATEAVRERQIKRTVFHAGAIALITLAFFYATNPYLWQAPLAGVAKIFRNVPWGERSSLIDVFTGFFLRAGLHYPFFALVGCLTLIGSPDRRRRSFLLASSTLWLTTLLVVPRDWPRYYLIALVPMTIFAAQGICALPTADLPSSAEDESMTKAD